MTMSQKLSFVRLHDSPGADNRVTQRRDPQRLAPGVECQITLKIQRQIALKFTARGLLPSRRVTTFEGVPECADLMTEVRRRTSTCPCHPHHQRHPGDHGPELD